MCVVSMVGDHFNDRFKEPDYSKIFNDWNKVTKEEFNQLKRDVEEMKKLLQRAKEYDIKNGEPDCEIEEKIAKLREIAGLVGISLDDVLIEKK